MTATVDTSDTVLNLKAYAVQDGYEGYATLVFATNCAAARREGANELGIEWEEVEHCRRAPELDKFAPGPVSPLDLIEHGWWFECMHCGRRVSDEMADDLESDGLNPDDFVPRPAGKHGVFCSEGCECADHMAKRGRAEAEEALIEVFEAKFPGATIGRVHVCDGPLLRAKSAASDPVAFVVYFMFPGGRYSASWEFGDEMCMVAQCDVDAYKAWRGMSRPASANWPYGSMGEYVEETA